METMTAADGSGYTARMNRISGILTLGNGSRVRVPDDSIFVVNLWLIMNKSLQKRLSVKEAAENFAFNFFIDRDQVIKINSRTGFIVVCNCDGSNEVKLVCPKEAELNINGWKIKDRKVLGRLKYEEDNENDDEEEKALFTLT